MSLNATRIAIAASAIFFMSAFNLYAGVGASGAAIAADPAEMSSDPMPAATPMPYSGGWNSRVPRFELFAGYSYIRAVPTYAYGNRLVWLNGGSTSLAFNLSPYLGLVGDFGAYTNSQVRFTGGYTGTVDVDNANVAVLTYLFGPRFSYRNHSRFTPFAQVLFGRVHANQVLLANCTANCVLLPSAGSFAETIGGGLDLRVHRHFALRLIQAEYLMTRFPNYTTGTSRIQNDMRLSSGIIFQFGGGHRSPELPPIDYSCSVNPATVYPGDPISVSGTAQNLNPAKTAVYTWSANGGTVTEASDRASIDTKQMTPGEYTLKGHVSQGDKARENADCNATYSVRALEPPTVSCAADPSVVISGNPSTITTTAISPQNRPLTYSYSSTAGTVNGVGATATLSTEGAPIGAITVTCNIADDKGQTAAATTSVTFAAPVAAPKPLTSDLCSVHFDRDVRRPSRVDNEAKACLDGVALNLQQNSNANLAIVGNANSSEKNAQALAAERAMNTKAYLVSEKGIDSSRIAAYSGTQDSRIVSITLIPAEATFDATGDTPAR